MKQTGTYDSFVQLEAFERDRTDHQENDWSFQKIALCVGRDTSLVLDVGGPVNLSISGEQV